MNALNGRNRKPGLRGADRAVHVGGPDLPPLGLDAIVRFMSKRQIAFDWLRERQHLLLVLVLVALHLVSAAEPVTITGRWLWLIDAGLFLLWQPFVGSDQRLQPVQSAVILVSVFAIVWQFGWGWLALWQAFLAALIGGKVVMARGVRHRWFYLIAFTYMVGSMLVWVSPNIVPGEYVVDPVFAPAIHITAIGMLFAIALVMPRSEAQRPPELHDFLASLLILLLLLVVLLGTLALIALRKLGYYEALALTLLGAGGALLLLSWAWNPKPGFGGVGASLSGYLLRIGLDFDRWLKRQLDLAETEQDAEKFLVRSLEGFAELPWVSGGEWKTPRESGSFGEAAKHATDFDYRGVAVKLFTPYAWSASLIWQASLLLKLVVELHHAKAREDRLRQMEYLEAVHETGARLTHDIKNLLQSMESLCYAAERTAVGDAERLAALIRRQLPALGQRLRSALDKLQHPQDRDERPVSIESWWGKLKQRYSGMDVVFEGSPGNGAAVVPPFLFDSVVDNLLANAIYKRQLAPEIEVVVALEVSEDRGLRVSVRDSGGAIPDALASNMFRTPLPSSSGLGIGLFQASRQARESGFELRIAENRTGGVCFELAGAARPG